MFALIAVFGFLFVFGDNGFSRVPIPSCPSRRRRRLRRWLRCQWLDTSATCRRLAGLPLRWARVMLEPQEDSDGAWLIAVAVLGVFTAAYLAWEWFR